MKITKTVVDNMKLVGGKEAAIWDSELPGFGVRMQAGGRKTYLIRYRTNDAARTQRKLVIGRCSDMPPEKARAIARDKFTAIAAGSDPAAERKPAARSSITLEAMFKARIASMKAKNRANADEVERVLLLAKHNAADAIGRDKAPGDVTPDDIIKFVAKHYVDGHRGAADKARGYLAAAFSWAIKSANDYTVEERQDWGVKHNPAADVAKDAGAVGVRERNLDRDEIRTFWNVCQDGQAGLTLEMEVLFRTLIACGQRVQETLRLEGSELDLEKGVWNMPAPKTKSRKRNHTIPLPSIIIPSLQALKDKHGDGLLFPSHQVGKGMIATSSVSQSVRRWLDTDGVEMVAFQPRDLRRTWKSRTHDAGVDRFTRDLIQQHAKNDTGSKNYDRADYYPQMRAAMDKWDAWLKATIYGAEVVQLVA